MYSPWGRTCSTHRLAFIYIVRKDEAYQLAVIQTAYLPRIAPEGKRPREERGFMASPQDNPTCASHGGHPLRSVAPRPSTTLRGPAVGLPTRTSPLRSANSGDSVRREMSAPPYPRAPSGGGILGAWEFVYGCATS